MTKTQIEQNIISLKEKVSSEYDANFRGLWFFGSQAIGTAGDDSDVDILLVFAQKPSWKEKNVILDCVADFEIGTGLIIDAKIYTENELQNKWTPFREIVQKEGAFYGR